MAEYPNYLIHYGTPGQKWGTRRYQNEDGSLTPEGYIHYGYGKGKNSSSMYKIIKDKNEKDKIIKQKNKKPEARIKESGFTIDKKWKYAEKDVNGVSFSFNANKKDKTEMETIDKKLEVCKKLEDNIQAVTKNLDKERDRIIKSGEFDGMGDFSKHNIKLQGMHIYSDGLVEASYWDDGPNDPLYGHMLNIQFDPKTGKIKTHSVDG